MSDTVTVFAIQAARFQRPDFQIGQAASDPHKLPSTNIQEAFVYAPANQHTVLPAWILETETFKHFSKHGLIKLYDKPISEDKAAIETAAASAEARLSSEQKEQLGIEDKPAIEVAATVAEADVVAKKKAKKAEQTGLE
jgi:hypothetical protein